MTELTPLGDPDNVQFFVVDDYVYPEGQGGFTDEEVQRILNGQPLTASAAFESREDKYDGGGMIALIPSDEDLDRLTLDGQEERGELHLTLYYLGEDVLTPQQRQDVLRQTINGIEEFGPIQARAFGAAHWNPEGENPAWVVNVGDADSENPQLAKLRGAVGQQVVEDFALPTQHTPWQPHICLAYTSDDLLDELTERLGSVTFDKIRVAFGRDNYDFELGEDVLTAAGGRRNSDPNQLKRYWTKGEGLAKWVNAAHPWTTLYRHLKKHMPNEMAKRVASQWYHDVKGHWPNEKSGK